jgi:hypothetical protein
MMTIPRDAGYLTSFTRSLNQPKKNYPQKPDIATTPREAIIAPNVMIHRGATLSSILPAAMLKME